MLNINWANDHSLNKGDWPDGSSPLRRLRAATLSPRRFYRPHQIFILLSRLLRSEGPMHWLRLKLQNCQIFWHLYSYDLENIIAGAGAGCTFKRITNIYELLKDAHWKDSWEVLFQLIFPRFITWIFSWQNKNLCINSPDITPWLSPLPERGRVSQLRTWTVVVTSWCQQLQLGHSVGW